MTRVLVGNLGPMAQLGFRDLVVGSGCEVVADGCPCGELLDRVVELLPDVVVVGDQEADLEMAAALSATFPSIQVVAVSSASPDMRVFPPFHLGESYDLPLNTQLLLEALLEKGTNTCPPT